MRSVFASIWDVVKPEVTGFLGTEESRQNKVTSLLIDKPFEFGKDLGFYGDKIQAPDLIDTTNPNNTVKQNAIASMNDGLANMAQESEVFRKNLPASLFEIGEFGIDLAMNPIKYGKEALNLGSGFATMPFENIDNASNEEMARMVVDSTIDFFKTEGALRKAALENPADVLAIMFGGASGIRRLQQLKPETTERIMTTIKNVGATPVGLSMRDVSNDKQYAKVDDAGFYLRSEQVVLDQLPKSIPAEQLKGWFEKRQVSNQELQDLGVMDFIDSFNPKDKITKEGLLEQIDNNRITTTGVSLEYDPDLGQREPDDVYIMDAGSDYNRDFEPSWDAQGKQEIRFADGSTETASWSVMDEDGDYLYDRGKELFKYEYGNQYRGGELGSPNEKYPYNLGRLQTHHKDKNNMNLIRYLHESDPEKYPMTKALEIDKAITVDNPFGEPERILDHNKEKVEMIKADIQDRERQGIVDWDQRLMYLMDEEPDLEQLMTVLEADDVDDFIPQLDGTQLPNSRLYSDIENYVDELGQKEYLENPEFEILVPMPNGNGQYTVKGNDDNGYRIYDPDGKDLISGGAGGDNYFNDMPAVQMAIEEHSVDYELRSFGGEPDTETRWSDYTQFDGSEDYQLGGGTNYSEELIVIDGNTFTKTHNPDYKGVGAHVRKTHRSEYVNGSDNDPQNIYYIEELQSDFHQQSRQFGYTEEERLEKYAKQRDVVNNASQTENAWTAIDEKYRKLTSTHQMQIRYNDNSFMEENAELLNAIDTDLLLEALLSDMVHWKELKTKESISGDRVLSKEELTDKQKIVDEFITNWPQSVANPKSPNFQGFDRNILSKYKKWFMNNTNVETRKLNEIDNHKPQPKAPFKGKRYINTGLKYAINQAIKDGKDTVVWTPAYMQRNMWGDGTDNRGVPGNKNLYDQLYNKDIPNFAKKFAKKYGKGDEVQVIEVNMDNQAVQHLGIRITPEIIKNMRKEFPELSTVGKGKVENQGFSDEYLKSRKAGLPQELYSGIPIGAGLLATQQQEEQRQGLLL